MLDDIYVLYENAGKFFPTYNDAWKNTYTSHSKTVRYCFTPTMQLCKRVSELENVARKYFNRSYGLDYMNVFTGEGHKQLKIIGEI